MAFSAPFAVFTVLIAKRVQLLIVTITAAFFWLLSLMLTALMWYLLTPLQTSFYVLLPVSVAMQEIARFFFFRLYSRLEQSFSVVSTNAIAFPMTDIYSSLAAGVGFAGMHGVLMYGTLISNSAGAGTLFADNCPQFSTFVVSSWLAAGFGILHMLLMVIALDGYRNKSTLKLGIVFILHLGANLLTLLNLYDGGCVLSIPLVFAVVIIAGALMFYIISRPTYRSNKRDL